MCHDDVAFLGCFDDVLDDVVQHRGRQADVSLYWLFLHGLIGGMFWFVLKFWPFARTRRICWLVRWLAHIPMHEWLHPHDRYTYARFTFCLKRNTFLSGGEVCAKIFFRSFCSKFFLLISYMHVFLDSNLTLFWWSMVLFLHYFILNKL